MTKSDPTFDARSVREAWDRTAAGFDRAQTSGMDYYRLDFFGPAQVEMCGDVRDMSLIDVGCGSGYFAREMARRGARVTGIDVSPEMISIAERREAGAPLGISYRAGDAAALHSLVTPASFDIATSCLALQDMPNVPAVVRGVYDALRPGARFVASITHPATNPPFRRWERDERGEKRWLCIDRYYERGPVECTWERFGETTTTLYMHAPLADWFAWFLGAGFRLRAFGEPCPTADALRARPELEDAARVPYYAFFDFLKPA